MSNPLRFETLNRKFNFEAGTIEKMSQTEGFPLAGEGVARFEEVQAWLEKTTSPEAGAGDLFAAANPSAEVTSTEVASDPVGLPESAAAVVTVEDDPNGVVEYMTIRVPICRNGPSLPGTNPVQTMRLASHERHIRDAWGKFLHGCRLSGVTMASGKPVKTVADSLKFLLERVAIEID